MDRPGWMRVGGVGLEVEVLGTGEPVVVIQTALGAEDLHPLARHVATTGRHRVVHYHRRGYAGSSPQDGPPSMEGDAEDCRVLMSALGISPAHVVGASYSAAVALTLASSTPEFVRTVVAIEPPPAHPGAEEFRTANARLVEVFRARGAVAALEEFMTMLVGPGWRAELDHGTVSAIERDAATFFAHDVPALVSWRFGVDDAAKVTCPVLHLGGAETRLVFAQMRSYLLEALPLAESATLAAAGHLVASTHPAEAAHLVVDFVDRHPRTD